MRFWTRQHGLCSSVCSGCFFFVSVMARHDPMCLSCVAPKHHRSLQQPTQAGHTCAVSAGTCHWVASMSPDLASTQRCFAVLQVSASLLHSLASVPGAVRNAQCTASVRCMQALGKGQTTTSIGLTLASHQVIADQLRSDQVRSVQLSFPVAQVPS